LADSKRSSSEWKRRVLRHVDRFGLTTHDALTRVVFDGDRKRRHEVVEALLRRGELVRRGSVLLPSDSKLHEKAIHARFSILAFACLGTTPRQLVPRKFIEEIFEPMGEDAPVPKQAECVIDDNKRLSLIRVHPASRDGQARDLNRTLGILQSFVEAESFRPWAYLALKDGLSISYLMHDAEEARELSLWTERRPLMSRLLSSPLVVPLAVHAVGSP